MRSRIVSGLAAFSLALAGTTVAVSDADAASLEDRTNVGFSSGGLSSEYHVYAGGLDADEPVGLLLQFHGDGAYEFRNPSSSYSLGGANGIVAKAREHNLITVPVLAPDTAGSVTWWESGSANADYVRALLAHLRSEYPEIRSDRIWLVGYSGGAQFITQFFLPEHSETIGGGGSVVFGGGGAPRVSVQPFSDAFTSGFPMHWYTGLDDDGSGGSYNALRDARAGSAYYGEQGFDVDLTTPSGVGHGLSGRFGPIVGGHLDDHANDTTTPTPEPTPEPGTAPGAWGSEDATGSERGATSPGPSGGRYTDVSGNVHLPAIERLTAAGVLRGHADGTYRPADELTRGQLATILTGVLDLDPDACRHACRRVDIGDSVHEQGIRAVLGEGIARGYDDGSFGADDGVSRGQFASLLARAFAVPEAFEHPFTDLGGSVHESAIAALVGEGATTGTTPTTFAPSEVVSRAQAATLLDGFVVGQE